MEWRHSWRAMGVDCAVVCPTPSDAAWWEQQVEAYEQTFSRFRPDSELCRLSARGVLDVSADLQQLMLAALEQAHTTQGLVVPHLGTTMRAIGYDRTFAAIQSNPEPIDYPALPDWRAIHVRGRRITVPSGMALDLNGVAKGWIAQRLAERCGLSKVLVEIGGEVACVAPLDDPWYVAVDHPTEAEPLALVRVALGTVATSSVHERRWQRGGATIHHIIDPRTGVPAQSDVVTATVIARDGVTAEAAAKYALIAGSTAGIAWVASQGLAGMVLTTTGEIRTTPFWASFLWDAA